MIDLHSHLLPGVDDGSRSVDASVRELNAFIEAGVVGVACTPHRRASNASGGWPTEFESAWAALTHSAPKGIRLYRGAEVMIDQRLAIDAGCKSLAINGGRYILIEFHPTAAAQTIASSITDVVAGGLIPLIAHAERYEACSPTTVEQWRKLGATIQVDATTLTRQGRAGAGARALLDAGLADIIAADNHADGRSLLSAKKWLVDMNEHNAARLLLELNPKAIIESRATEPVPPLKPRVTNLTTWQKFVAALRGQQ